MKYQAVIFDLDGTLLDTLDDLVEATNHGLTTLGFPLHRRNEFRYFIGAGREVLASLSLPEEHRDPATVTHLCQLVDIYYDQHWTDHTWPYPGIQELLNALDQRGVRKAVLSNKPQRFAELNVTKLLNRWQFAPVLGALPSVPRKPDPTVALKIAHQLGLKPENIIYLGDSDIDMFTAVNAGMYPAGAVWGFRTYDELKAAGARSLLAHPTDLLKLLD